jgi:hypothetical protein
MFPSVAGLHPLQDWTVQLNTPAQLNSGLFSLKKTLGWYSQLLKDIDTCEIILVT